MSEIQSAFGQPGVGLLAMLLIGAIAGWIAEQVTKSDHGIFTNILVGIAGCSSAARSPSCCRFRSSVSGAP